MKTEHSISRVEEPYSKRSMSSSSTCLTLESVKDEHWDGVNQVKMENQLVVEVKSEKPEAEPTVNNTKFENMDIWTLNEGFDIKNEWENDVSDRIKVEEKLEPGLEADSAAATVNQMKMEFQESEKLEEKPELRSTNLENMYALGLHHEFVIKTESDQDDRHDSASDSAVRKQHGANKKITGGIPSTNTIIMEVGFIQHLKMGQVVISHDVHDIRAITEVFNIVAVIFIFHQIAKGRKIYCTEVAMANSDWENCRPLTQRELQNEVDNVWQNEDEADSDEDLFGELSDRDEDYVDEQQSGTDNEQSDDGDEVVLQNPDNKNVFSFLKVFCCIFIDYLQLMCNFILICNILCSNTINVEPNEQNIIKIFSSTNYLIAQIKKNREKEQRNLPIEEGKQSFSCYICNYTSHCKNGLIGHIKRNNCYLRSNLGKSRSVSRKQYQYCCIKCNKVFKSKTSLDNHLVKNHVGSMASVSSKIHECTSSDFKTAFKCINCDASFNTKRRLENHTLQKHPKMRKCTHCEYKTTYRQCLARHMMKHTGAKLKCTKCDESFTTTQSLNHHILRKHPDVAASVSCKIHKCTHCEYKTTYRHCLTTHMMKHTGAKLKCTKCDKSFTTILSLDGHILRNHSEFTASVSRKIHKCTHCEYKTTYKGNLVSHMVKHTGAMLKCTKCDKSFTTTQSSDHHILQKHPDLLLLYLVRYMNVRIVNIKLHFDTT
ncbi:unnamed protein product [Acanthoscelides obtectus]|uniref:C2H2-type domain-containing protein n=1 Tax=Acanthoscelides obtectus TaxID=200917 RepID=A0A9P0MKN7_ACAOB|nr:unnamed protein product [Acanthoscelides obtectus]CAK1670566.1 Zinc finger protein 711 [Acanthoscelides obtectus]